MPAPKTKKRKKKKDRPILQNQVLNPIWISVSEAAKLCGVSTKTIRRAIQANAIPYKIIKNRYVLDLRQLILFALASVALKNKLNSHGLGQYIEKWHE